MYITLITGSYLIKMKQEIINFATQLIYPDVRLVFFLMLMIALDLLSGIRKSNTKGKATISAGLRKTIDKGNQYFTFIFLIFTIINVSKIADTENSFIGILNYSLNGLFIFLTYIEIKSILENQIETSPDSDLTKYFAIPLHNIIILKFKQILEKSN